MNAVEMMFDFGATANEIWQVGFDPYASQKKDDALRALCLETETFLGWQRPEWKFFEGEIPSDISADDIRHMEERFPQWEPETTESPVVALLWGHEYY